MKCSTFFAVMSAAVVAATASAADLYNCTYNTPPFTAGDIVGQQNWVANGTVPTGVWVINSSSPQEGNGCLLGVSSGATPAAYEIQNVTDVSAAWTAAAAASAVDFDVTYWVKLPVASTGPAAFSMNLLTNELDSASVRIILGGLRVWAGPYSSATSSFATVAGEVTMNEYLGAPYVPAPGGNYTVKFTPANVLTIGTWTKLGIRWQPFAKTVFFSFNGGDWVETPYPQNTMSSLPATLTPNRLRNNSTPYSSTNTVSAQLFEDTLNISSVAPAYPQCNPNAGNCAIAHAGGGCATVSCCESVCGLQPSCCSASWDQSCVDLAVPTCGIFIYNCTNPNTPANNCATSPTVIVPSLPSAPVNLPYDTTLATTDGPPQPQCGSGPSDTPVHKDVWWRFIAPNNGTLVASNCNTGNHDSKIAVYNIGTNLAAFDPNKLPDYFVNCNEDCGDPVYSSEVSVPGIVAGNYYLVRLGGYAGATGSGTIRITLAPPPNPCDPANLIQGVAGTNVVTVDTLYSGFDVGTYCTSFTGNIAHAKFIKFTPSASGTMQVDNCVDTGAQVDARIAVMTSCGNAATIIGCDDDSCAAGASPYTSKVVCTVTGGVTYYIAVGGYSDSIAGPFTVTIAPPTAPPCPADLNHDGVVNGADLGLMLGAWGPCPAPCSADLNHDGIVNGADLGLLLGAWGACPQ